MLICQNCIGTFEGLDGEMVALAGNFYQTKADGVAYQVGDDMTLRSLIAGI
jgi:acetolactate decarboxylase